MSIRQKLSQELGRLRGTTSPTTTSVSGPGGLSLQIDFLAVDTIGCSFEQLTLDVPSMQGAAFDLLKQWAQDLTSRITYLLEKIGPLEFDPDAGQVLIRSTPPDQLPDGTQYYEILLQSQTGGRVTLRRYLSVKGQSGRQSAPMTVTQEVLLKLADDLVATIPSGTP